MVTVVVVDGTAAVVGEGTLVVGARPGRLVGGPIEVGAETLTSRWSTPENNATAPRTSSTAAAEARIAPIAPLRRTIAIVSYRSGVAGRGRGPRRNRPRPLGQDGCPHSGGDLDQEDRPDHLESGPIHLPAAEAPSRYPSELPVVRITSGVRLTDTTMGVSHHRGSTARPTEEQMSESGRLRGTSRAALRSINGRPTPGE